MPRRNLAQEAAVVVVAVVEEPDQVEP